MIRRNSMNVSSAPPLFGLILSGGGGTRLWPMSQDDRPKQFLRLTGEETLFQITWRRLREAGVGEAYILTNLALEALARADLAELGATGAHYVLEPARRDSGPAVAAGVAAILARHGADAHVLVAASDHLIPDVGAYAGTIAKARVLANAGYLVTFGITPRFPATEYGYLQRGEAVPGIPDGFRVRRFHEKPAIDRATAYVSDPEFSWNSGMFLFRAGCFAEEASQHMPDIWQAACDAVAAGAAQGDRLVLDPEIFGNARRISLDFALMERSERVGMVPATFDWSDIGSWAAVHAASTQDERGNAVSGRAATRDVTRSLVIADGLPVLAIGLDGYVVVATQQGVFIAPAGRSQEIKALLDSLPAI